MTKAPQIIKIVGMVILVLAIAVSGSISVHAKEKLNYKEMIDEIGVFLNEALSQHKKGNIQEAKLKAQAAYFEVFENLEGPIRINISAKKNYELEEEFTGIRNMIVGKAPAAEVEKRIKALMAELGTVVSELEGGVELVAEASKETKQEKAGTEGKKSTGNIEPVWLQAFEKIQAGLGNAVETYKKGDSKRAAELLIQTQFDHYKNSLLETAIRRHVSQKRDFENNSGFSEIVDMIRSGSTPGEVETKIAGLVVYFVALRQETVTAARVSLYAAAILAAICNGGSLFLSEKRSGRVSLIGWGGTFFFTAALASVTAFSFLGRVAEQALSATTVLNTELILNIAGIMAGASLIVFLIPLTARLGKKSGRKIVSGFILFVSLFLAVLWSAEILLGLMRLEMVELTSTRLSFVAKVSKYSGVLPYIQIFILAALSLLFFTRRTALTSHDLSGMEKAERRKARSRALFEMRWFRAALLAGSIIFAVLLYHDLYASRPPKISPPVNLKPDPSGLIRVRISDVADGKLHRYSYVTDDGHVVRFFMITSGRQKKIGVVYDACMLCGDMGYIQEKNEVVCIACNVRIFIPSIGKAGGCNPIPLKHKVEGEYVVISTEDLDKGARYFSEVVLIKVKDPVTGKELINLKRLTGMNTKAGPISSNLKSLKKNSGPPPKPMGGSNSRDISVHRDTGSRKKEGASPCFFLC